MPACRRRGPAYGRSRHRNPAPRCPGCRTPGRWQGSVEHLHVMAFPEIARQPLLEARLQRLIVQGFADVLLHLFQGLVAAGDALVHPEQVKAAAAADRLADLARLEPEEHLLQIALHLAAGEGAELAALVRPGAFRILPREGAEIAPGERELPHLLGLGPRVRESLLVARVSGNEDVPHPDALGDRVVVEVLVVVPPDLLGRDVDVLADLPVDQLGLLDLSLDLGAIRFPAHALRLDRLLEARVVHSGARLDLVDVAVDLVVAGHDAERLDLSLEELVGDERFEDLAASGPPRVAVLGVLLQLVGGDGLAVDRGDDAIGDLRPRRHHPQHRREPNRPPQATAGAHRGAAYHAAEILCKSARSSAMSPS